jgi:ABC-2 type transport system permease protein
MITRIAKKEFLEMWRDGRFRWTALIVVVLLGMTLILGGKHYVTTKKEREAELMYSQIIKNDWKNLIGDRSVWLVAVGLALLLGYAIYNGAKWSGAQSHLHQTLVQEQQQRLTEAKDRLTRGETKPQPGQPDPSDAYAIGTSLAYAVLPSSPLSFTSIGQSDLLRPTVGVSVLSKQRTVADKQGFENPLVLLAGRFDLAFVIIYLLPLVVLAFSFNLLSAETRERHTPIGFIATCQSGSFWCG